jgi:predicted nucleic acid-binding protein
MIVLDTNVVSEQTYKRPDPAVLAWLDSLPRADVATTAVTAAELLSGIARMPLGRRRQEVEEAVRDSLFIDLEQRILPFDVAAAQHYADIVAVRFAAGRPIGIPDAQIAAICRQRGATLATRNTKDFVGTGVELVNPWLARQG